MPTKLFAVVTVSTTTNSFGLRGFIAVAKDGTAFEAAANSLNVPQKGQKLDLALTPGGSVNYAARGWEIPRDLPKAPRKVVKAAFAA